MKGDADNIIEMSFSEIFKDARETSFFDEVTAEIRSQQDAKSQSSGADSDDDWSALANQVVGHENL